MEKNDIHFWEIKHLDEMSNPEWDLLCDNCGLCCLEKIEHPGTGQINVTPMACRFLDTFDCSCIIYEERFTIEPDCIKINPQNVNDFSWLPKTCAYRRVYEGKSLESWHPLISGDPKTVHEAGISVRGKALPYGYYPFGEGIS